MARTQKNKATAYHIGTLKAKLAKLKRELITPSGGGGGKGEGTLFIASRLSFLPFDFEIFSFLRVRTSVVLPPFRIFAFFLTSHPHKPDSFNLQAST